MSEAPPARSNRLRLSLKQLMLLTAAVAALFTFYRQSQLIATRERELKALRAELGELRIETQQLEVEDPRKLTVRAIGDDELGMRTWRIYMPPGVTRRLFLQLGGLPSNGLPKIEWDPQPGRSWLDRRNDYRGWELDKSGEYLFSTHLDGRLCIYELKTVPHSRWTRLAHKLGGGSGSLTSTGSLGDVGQSDDSATRLVGAGGLAIGDTHIGDQVSPTVLLDTRPVGQDGPDLLIWMEAPP